MSETLYLATEKNVKVTGESVALGEIARLTCADPHVLARAKALKGDADPGGAVRPVCGHSRHFD